MKLTDAADSESRGTGASVSAALVRTLGLGVAGTILSARSLAGTVGKAKGKQKQHLFSTIYYVLRKCVLCIDY